MIEIHPAIKTDIKAKKGVRGEKPVAARRRMTFAERAKQNDLKNLVQPADKTRSGLAVALYDEVDVREGINASCSRRTEVRGIRDAGGR